MFEDLLQVRSAGVCFYVLRDEDALYLLDTGFIGARAALRRALKERGWDGLPVRGILLTHGHLDHVLHAAALAKDERCWIAAPEQDLPLYLARADVGEVSLLVKLLEGAGRALLGYEPFTPNRLLQHGAILPIWGGLQVVHLPGHTLGHVGYYSASKRLMFTGDSFASYSHWSHLPPVFLNAESQQVRSSVAQVLKHELSGVFPHHCDSATPSEHLARLRRLMAME